MTSSKASLPHEPGRLEDSDPFQVLQLSGAPIAVRYLAALVMTAFAAVIAAGLDSRVTIPNLSLVFVIPVVVAAVAFGLGPSLCSAVLGAFAYNFFFTEPRYSLMVDDPANVWAIALLFVVGCIASGVASIARRRADDAELLMRQAGITQLYTHDVVVADDAGEIVSLAASTLEALFQVPVVVMLMSENAVTLSERRGEIQLSDVEMEAAQSCLTTCRPVPAGIYPYDTSRLDFWPVSTPSGQQAVIGLAFNPDERPSRPATTVETVAGILALAIDREHARRDS
jgi:two-component system sensor histidine kinase KdpD